MKGYKNTYFFRKGNSFPEFKGKSKDELKSLLGGKGYGLYLMICELGLQSPAVLNLPTFHSHSLQNGRLPESLVLEVKHGLNAMEATTGKAFGDPKNPLLVSARSGAKMSMPGMMDTILNIGLNDEIIEEIARGELARFWLDSYRRLLQMYGEVVLQIHDKNGDNPFEHAFSSLKEKKGTHNDLDMGPDDLSELITQYKKIYSNANQIFPQSPEEQILRSCEAVFRSWNNERAIFTRRLEGIPDNLGTAVNIQEMVFGNKTSRSATGVFFTRDKSTGLKSTQTLDGTILFQAQGEDVVAGIRNSLPLEALRDHEDPAQIAIYHELKKTGDFLEKRLKNMQDAEFTIEEKNGEPLLYWLQIRDGKRSAKAESVIAVAMHNEGLISKDEAIQMVNAERFEELLFPQITDSNRREATLLTKGSASSPGAATGKIVFTQEDALQLAEQNEDVILTTVMTSQEDVQGMKASKGILTTTGTKVSHAAIMATAWGIPAVVGASDLYIDLSNETLTVNNTVLKKGDTLTINGTTGEVFLGDVPKTIPEQLEPAACQILDWCRERKFMAVRANAEAAESSKAYEKGARGIGLFRTEHMFLDERLAFIQDILFQNDSEKKKHALEAIFSFSKNDFKQAMKVMDGNGVTIRLLDAPLHEFMPPEHSHLVEENPMLGHRSVRMAITNPEIAHTQIKAILEAAFELRQEGFDPKPEIEIPLVILPAELIALKKIAATVAQTIYQEKGKWIPYAFGLMVETPAAALQGKAMVHALQSPIPGIPKEAQPHHFFASFGTNDLTQTTLAISRDDADKFLPLYVEKHFFQRHPFLSIHPTVEQLIEMFVKDARSVDPQFEIFVCGEHGGDSYSIERLHRLGLTGVSISPGKVYRAIIKAAQTQIEYPQ